MTMTGPCFSRTLIAFAMHRFHVSSPPSAGVVVELDRDESHHAAKVLRLCEGAAVELLDGAGHVAAGVIASVGRIVKVSVTQVTTVAPPSPAVTIAAAIPKGPRADAMIEQLSQLGASELIPLLSRRSVVDPRETKIEKFQRAAIESAKQCGRAWFMRVEAPTDFATILRAKSHGARLLADLAGKRDALVAAGGAATSVLVLIGPEGGFTEQERADAIAAGFLPWSLGENILRIETAAVAAVAIARHVLQATP